MRLETSRLIIRPWQAADLPFFHELNACPEVNRFFPATLDEQKSLMLLDRFTKHSCRVMEKVGMTHYPDENFEHPRVPEGHALREHVLYRLFRKDWLSSQ